MGGEGVADPFFVPVGGPAAAAYQQVPGVGVVEGPRDVRGCGDGHAVGECSELVESLREAAENRAEFALDPLLKWATSLPTAIASTGALVTTRAKAEGVRAASV